MGAIQLAPAHMDPSGKKLQGIYIPNQTDKSQKSAQEANFKVFLGLFVTHTLFFLHSFG